MPLDSASSVEPPPDLDVVGRPKDFRHEPERDKSVLLLGDGNGVRSDKAARKGEFSAELVPCETLEAMLDVDRVVRSNEPVVGALVAVKACCMPAVSDADVSKMVGVSVNCAVVA